jgi:hypothetical protein
MPNDYFKHNNFTLNFFSMNNKVFLLIVFLTQAIISQTIDSTNNQVKIFSDSTLTTVDSLSLSDSLITQIKPDSIAPIYSTPLTANSFIISNDVLLHNDYKYTGDYLRVFPFNFIKDLGFTGQPNETFLYGIGNNSIGYLMDGVSVNDRYSNSLNLNLIQSEDVDSIEIVPLPRGFLYGAYSNPVSVNFITNDFITKQPYTRIRFYQGANRDMMFDGSFNAKVMNRLIASFNITNRILDETYKATGYSIWQGKFKLKYLLSNDVNILASYNMSDYKAGYSGGVDIDSITASGRIVDDVMYSSLDNPPMFYPDGKLNSLTHLPRLRVLATPMNWLKTDASVFYLYNENELITDEKNYAESKTFGVNIKNEIQWSLFNFQVNADYENQKVSSNSIYNYDEKLFSISGILSAYFNDSSFIPSVYYKMSTNKINSKSTIEENIGNYKKNKNGFGFDMLLKLKSNLGFYFGTSFLKNNTASSDNDILMEIGAKLHTSDVKVDLKYFINEYKDYYDTGGMFFNSYQYGNLNGIGVNLSLNLWKLLVENYYSYYSSKSIRLYGVPNFQAQTGLYFKDILFDNNLDLKTGFVFYYTGKNNVFTYENGLVEVPASNKLDFTLVGEIQKAAIIYFTWQNLLGNKYYIMPYYPMPGRSIRFGVAWEMFN